MPSSALERMIHTTGQSLPAYLELPAVPSGIPGAVVASPGTGFTSTSIVIQIVRPYLGTASRETYTGITTGNVVDGYGRTKHNQPLHDDTGAWWVRACNDNDKWQTDRAFQHAWSCPTEPPVCLGCQCMVRGRAFSMPELPAVPPVCLGCLPFLQRPVDAGYCRLRVRKDNDKWSTTVVRTWTHQTGAVDARYGAEPPVCLGCPTEPSSMPGTVVLPPRDRSRPVPGRIGLVSC